MEITNYTQIIGKTIGAIEVIKDAPDHRQDRIKFAFSDGSVWTMTHDQDCCESVTLEDVNGDWEDLIGSPLLEASERSQNIEESDSTTWTFYIFATNKGTISLRWIGNSNGYYSESVEFTETQVPTSN